MSAGTSTASDPFGTAALRERVLAAWAASAARFREDANAEEDAALGAYRDRLVVELAQNAVDAAAAAGVPCRLLLHLDDTALTAANTGAALTAGGVQALATLRASAKRDGESVGRFGVGFAAVLAVTDAPEVVGAGGGVRFSRRDTADLASGLPALAGELGRRRGAVPVLRLPFPLPAAPAAVPDGYDTAVRLPLRDAAARDVAVRLLRGLDPTLPLVLPGLAEVTVVVAGPGGGTRMLRCSWDVDDAELADDDRGTVVVTRWRGARERGLVPAGLLADRPVEERARTGYEVRALVPDGGWPRGVPRVLRAPQPTEEPLSLPVLLSAPVPLDPGRRHAVPGPLHDWLLERAAEVVAGLAARLPAGPAVLDLVPTGLAAGTTDAVLRERLSERLPDVALLPGATAGAGSSGDSSGHAGSSSVGADPAAAAAHAPHVQAWGTSRLRGKDSVVLDLGTATAAVAEVLGDLLPGLLPAGWERPARAAALGVLGVRRLDTAAVVAAVSGAPWPPQRWARLYAAVAGVPDREALAALPVPLADGRLVTGARGVLVPEAGLDAAALAASGLPLRVADPAVSEGPAGELLRGLGGVAGTSAGVLADPAVRDAVETAGDDAGFPGAAAPLAGAVLALVRDAGTRPGELAWLGRLPLPGDDGQDWPAQELVLPGCPFAEVLVSDAPFGRLEARFAAGWAPEVLEAVGVLTGFAVLAAADVVLYAGPDAGADGGGGDPLLDLDASDEWVEAVLDGLPVQRVPPVARRLVAVRDLELVDAARWPAALAQLAGPALRATVLEPAVVDLDRAGGVPVTPYTRWWLSRFALLPDGDGALQSPGGLLLPGADPLLAGAYDPVALLPGVDAAFLAAVGVRARLADVLADADDALDLLDRLGDASRPVTWPQARAVYLAAAAALLPGDPSDADGLPGDPPLAVRCGDGRAVPAAEALVVDAPDLLPLLGGRGQVRVPPAAAVDVATLLGLPLARSALARAVGAGAVLSSGRDEPVPVPLQGERAVVTVHDGLVVRDLDGAGHPVRWRLADGVLHVERAALPDALADGLAWAGLRWPQRHALAALLRDPEGAPRLAAEADLDG